MRWVEARLHIGYWNFGGYSLVSRGPRGIHNTPLETGLKDPMLGFQPKYSDTPIAGWFIMENPSKMG